MRWPVDPAERVEGNPIRRRWRAAFNRRVQCKMALPRQIHVGHKARPSRRVDPVAVRSISFSKKCYKAGMEQLAIKLLGFAAATCTTLAYAPQFVKVWRTRSTDDISLGMFLVMVLGLALWLLYGLLSGDGPLIASNAVTLVLAGAILFMKLKYG
jgi:MtN3 and saliva related transmembrane protein